MEKEPDNSYDWSPSDLKGIIFFINKDSGGGQGQVLSDTLCQIAPTVFKENHVLLLPITLQELSKIDAVPVPSENTPPQGIDSLSTHGEYDDSEHTCECCETTQSSSESERSLRNASPADKSSVIRDLKLATLELEMQDVSEMEFTLKPPCRKHENEQLIARQNMDKWTHAVCAGGDGTIAWALKSMDRLGLNHLPLAIAPLGTGNELARCSGWGQQLRPSLDSATKLVHRVLESRQMDVDKWVVTITTRKPNASKTDSNQEDLVATRHDMLCFVSLGFDAHIAQQFDELRRSSPGVCRSVLGNKVIHSYYGARHLFVPDQPLGSEQVSVFVDGSFVPLPEGIRTIQVFNIHSSADGTDFFGLGSTLPTERDLLQTFSLPTPKDGLLEVVATEGVSHLLKIRTGLSRSIRLAQGSVVEIHFNAKETSVCLQLDGEPWLQTEPCMIQITRNGRIPLLIGPKTLSGGFQNVLPTQTQTQTETQTQTQNQ